MDPGAPASGAWMESGLRFFWEVFSASGHLALT